MNLEKVLQDAVAQGASDIHLCSGQATWFRVQGDLFVFRSDAFQGSTRDRQYSSGLEKQQETAHRTHEADSSCRLMQILAPHIESNVYAHFLKGEEVDFSFTFPGVGRFRANVYKSLKGNGAVFRHIREGIPTLAEINAPRYYLIYSKVQGFSWSLDLQAQENPRLWRQPYITSIKQQGNTSSP